MPKRSRTDPHSHPFECSVCQKRLRSEAGLKRHHSFAIKCRNALNTTLQSRFESCNSEGAPTPRGLSPLYTNNDAPVDPESVYSHGIDDVIADEVQSPVGTPVLPREENVSAPEQPREGLNHTPSEARRVLAEDPVADSIEDPFPGAAEVKGRETPLFQSILQQQRARGGRNLYYPFAGQRDWDMAKWIQESRCSMSKVDKLLHTSYVKDRPLSFGCSKTFQERVTLLPDSRMRWLSRKIVPEYGTEDPEEPITLFYRNPVKCIQSLLDRPSLQDHLQFTPRRVWRDESRQRRVYDEIFTGDWAWRVQEELPVGGTLVPVLLGSDKTHLTVLAGDKKAWPVYLSIGNIKSTARNKPTNRAWVLIGYIPCPKFQHDKKDIRPTLQNRLFHQCMKIILQPLLSASRDGVLMVDSIGDQRLCFPRLAAYLADYPEQLLVNCAAGKNSPTTTAGSSQLGNSTPSPPRTANWILEKIKSVCERVDPVNVMKYLKLARKEGLNGVNKPFWEDHPGYRAEFCLAPDILHGLLRFWRDHPLEWVKYLLGEKELDARLRVVQPIVGNRYFKHGISHLSQWSGREDRELLRILFTVSLDGPEMDSKVVKCLRAFHDFLYIAQYTSHTTSTIRYLSDALDTFHELKDVFIEKGARRGETNVINHFNLPKLAAFHAYATYITEMGSLPQFSTEITETCHQILVKEPYRLTNFREYESQMCRWLDRDERMLQMEEFLKWYDVGYREINMQRELEAQQQDPSVYVGPVDTNPTPLVRTPAKALKTEHLRSLSPQYIQQPILHMAKLYKLPDLPILVAKFLRITAPIGEPLPILLGTIDAWTKFRIQMPAVQDSRELAQTRTVLALPPSKKMRYGLCNCVLVKNGEEADSVMIRGYRVAQVRLIFRLWFRNERHPLHLRPLVYVQWFSDPHPGTEDDCEMYLVKRLRDNGRALGEVIELSKVARLVQLIPRFGAMIAPELNVHNTMEICKAFYVNSFTDKEIYRAVY